MNVSKVLETARICNINIDAKIESLERLYFLIKHTTRTKDLDILMDKAKRLESEVNSQIDALIEIREQAGVLTASLPLEERAVFEQYYINSLDWNAVADKTHFSIRKVYNLRKSGLSILQNLYEDDKTHGEHRTCPST